VDVLADPGSFRVSTVKWNGGVPAWASGIRVRWFARGR
jgi:hypothetical protein